MLLASVCIGLLSVATINADVKSDEKSQVKFEGALGKMFNLFGGRAAREGLTSKVVVKGDRKLQQTGDYGQIIDLAEEKVYTLDYKKQSYTVETFDEIRRKMQEAQAKAKEQQAKAQKDAEKAEQNGEKPPDFEIDVSTKPTGQTKAINGFDTREVVTTVTVRQKGKTLEEAGGMVLTSDAWVAPTIAALKERMDFDMRYWTKLQGAGAASEVPAQQMAAALAMYPMLGEAMKRVHTEGQGLDGTPIQTTLTVEAVASPEQQQQQAESDESSGGGGLGGMLARKMMRKKKDDSDADPAAKGHAKVMTMSTEVLSVSTDVAADDTALPAGFKLKD
jgi:hypothetical protein